MSQIFKHAVAAVLLAAASAALAQIAQQPLLNRPNQVPPNLTLILDTSGSMDEDEIYEFGAASNLGPRGPGGSTAHRNQARRSPDVNKLYYDPRVRYLPRPAYDGTALALGTLRDDWEVYFRNTTGPYENGTTLTYHTPSYTPPAALVVPDSTATYPNSFETRNGGGWGGGTSNADAKFPKFIARTDCTTNATWCTRDEERRNYSIWYKWYRTRSLMAQTGMGLAFLPIKAESIRLGYATIKTLNDSSQLSRGVSLYKVEADGTKNLFFNWLYSRDFDGGTPNLVALDRVGKYHERTDSDGPWSTVPNPASVRITTDSAPSGPGKLEPPSSHASCRRSFAMLVTDGYWNGTVPTTAGNADNKGFSISPAIGPALVYTPAGPYADTVSNTMADLAMHYWGRDLRGDLANRVPSITTAAVDNKSSWQNMSFYAVTLGLTGTLPRTSTTLAELTGNQKAWPTPEADKPSTIDDTWHATINGRGELLNANNAGDLTNALKRMLDSIAGEAQTLSGVAVSATFLKSLTRKFKPEYIPGTWAGRLSAIELDSTTGNDKVPSNVYWQVEKGAADNGDPISLIPAPGARNIFTWSGTAGVAFNDTNTGLSADLVNYLRGDSSKELRKTDGIYRNRDAKLGDIINSSPVFIQGNVDLQYEKLAPALLDSNGDGYRAFVTRKAARPGVLFVGANDGMLHGFPNDTGIENFAFVPKAVVPNLFKLSETPYVHQYYVDGPNVETDAFLDGAWKNILLGTTGAGAKAVYALDVTNPNAMDGSKVLWEVNSSTTGFGELGHVLSDVQAGLLPNGNWVAVFGNGFGSASGQAWLYVVNLRTGALLKAIPAGAAGGNGLGGVRAVLDANRRLVGVYGGDLKGNMWKFDLTGPQTNWKVALSSNPLYAAGATQPITAAPAVLPHPSGGHVVTFGTGKFFETGDKDPPFANQRLYGIWDAQPFGASSTPAGAWLSGLSQLVAQTITSVTTDGSPTRTFYRVSANSVDWGDGLSSGKRGWYIDLPHSGQRVAYPVDRMAGTLVMASTLSPVSPVEADLCVQTGSGSGWVYVIDGVTGAGATKAILDTNGDGRISDGVGGDIVASGWQDPVDGRPTALTTARTETEEEVCIVTAQNTCTELRLRCGIPGMPPCPIPPPPGLKSREWRQLFMR